MSKKKLVLVISSSLLIILIFLLFLNYNILNNNKKGTNKNKVVDDIILIEKEKKETVSEDIKVEKKKEEESILEDNNSSTAKSDTQNATQSDTQNATQNAPEPKEEVPYQSTNVWDKLGMSEYQYYNEPMYKWEHVDFSINSYGSEGSSKNACLEYGDKYEPYLNGEALYHCTTVNTASGKYLGEMFHTENLIN